MALTQWQQIFRILTLKYIHSKIYRTICGPEFGPAFQNCKAHIVQALYGNICAEKDTRNRLLACMDLLGYTPCLLDSDLWMREAKYSNGQEYCEYVLIYIDDVLVVSEYPKEYLLEIDKYFQMKKRFHNLSKDIFGRQGIKSSTSKRRCCLCSKYEPIHTKSSKACWIINYKTRSST